MKKEEEKPKKKEKGKVYCPDCNGDKFIFMAVIGQLKCVKCGRLFNDIAD